MFADSISFGRLWLKRVLQIYFGFYWLAICGYKYNS